MNQNDDEISISKLILELIFSSLELARTSKTVSFDVIDNGLPLYDETTPIRKAPLRSKDMPDPAPLPTRMCNECWRTGRLEDDGQVHRLSIRAYPFCDPW